ncbi:MAG: hypothetical protein PHV60_06640, partial [bacterium]|nr:hypothetical protein [bacterium]
MAANTYIKSTIAYCPKCGKTELARIMGKNDGVYLERMCSQGLNSIKITGDYDWYINRVLTPQEYIPARIDNKHLKGCPFDCGPCAWHTGALNLPVFSITNDC